MLQVDVAEIVVHEAYDPDAFIDRAYNNAVSGAPNHRYTIDAALLDDMIRQGWTMEGEAKTRVFACVPSQP